MSVTVDVGPSLYIILILGVFAYIVYITLDFTRSVMLIKRENDESRREKRRTEASTV